MTNAVDLNDVLVDYRFVATQLMVEKRKKKRPMQMSQY